MVSSQSMQEAVTVYDVPSNRPQLVQTAESRLAGFGLQAQRLDEVVSALSGEVMRGTFGGSLVQSC